MSSGQKSQQQTFNLRAAAGDDERALLQAVIDQDATKVEELLLAGVSPNIYWANLGSPLYYAAISPETEECLKIVDLLMRFGANPWHSQRDYHPLFTAFGRTELNVLKIMLKYAPEAMHANVEGTTFLHFCAENGRPETLALLIDIGARVNIKDYVGRTPIMGSAFYGQAANVEMLLKAGADVDKNLPADINSPLIYALGLRECYVDDNQRTAIVEMLINAGADVNRRMVEKKIKGRDRYPFSESLDYAEFIISPGGTPLHQAAIWKHPKCAALLIKAGADPEALDSDNRKPLFYCQDYLGDAPETRRAIKEAMKKSQPKP